MNVIIFILAKQTKLSFPLNSIFNDSYFELIHVDIWGGYHFPSLSSAKYSHYSSWLYYERLILFNEIKIKKYEKL